MTNKNKPILADSHCHLDYFIKNGDLSNIADIVAEANKVNVEYLLSACTNLDNFPKLLQLAEQYPQIYISAGLHPSEEHTEPTVEQLAALARHEKVVAIGETGLDYHYQFIAKEKQNDRFRAHIRAAKLANKPLIIHNREADKTLINIIEEENAAQVGGVMHCFTGSLQMAQKFLEMGFYISFSGIITFKNADQLREVVKFVPLEKMLIETDSPYLAPVPWRGKINKPAYVTYVAECIADIKNVSFSVVATTTTNNFFRLFCKK